MVFGVKEIIYIFVLLNYVKQKRDEINSFKRAI